MCTDTYLDQRLKHIELLMQNTMLTLVGTKTPKGECLAGSLSEAPPIADILQGYTDLLATIYKRKGFSDLESYKLALRVSRRVQRKFLDDFMEARSE